MLSLSSQAIWRWRRYIPTNQITRYSNPEDYKIFNLTNLHFQFIISLFVKNQVNAIITRLTYIHGVSQLVDITAGGDFLGLSDQKSSYEHESDFRRLQSYDRLKLRR